MLSSSKKSFVEMKVFCANQVNEASACEPNTDQLRDELTEADAVRGLQDVQILKDIGNRHQTERPSES